MRGAPVRRLLYVTRLPPSPSGVAAYAEGFRTVLQELGEVEVERLPGEATSSQSVALAVRLAGRLLRRTRHRDVVVYVEQAGRGLAEFWAAWLLALRGRRVWLMVHDVPELSGGPFFTTLLDRRGGRRVAAALSATVGRACERTLLRRAERVFCLSESGARALEALHRPGRSVEALPFVALLGDEPVPGRHEVFAAGYIGGPEDVVPVVEVASALPEGWRVTVGACAEHTETSLRAAVAAAGVQDRVRFLGFTDEAGLRAAFARAAVVVRWRRDGWGPSVGPDARHAVSGPLIAAMAQGCAVVTNDSRGAAAMFDEAQVVTVGDGDAGARQLRAAVERLARDADERVRRAEAGRDLMRRVHSASAVAARMTGTAEQLATTGDEGGS